MKFDVQINKEIKSNFMLGVIVIIVENGLGGLSSNPAGGC